MKAFKARYAILIGTYIKVYLGYPMGLFLKMVYLPVQMMMYLFLWMQIGRNNEIDLSYMVCYYLFSILLGYAFPFAHIAQDIQADVFEGNISNCLVRPVHYCTPILAKYIAWICCYSIVFVPALLFVIVYRRVSLLNILYFLVLLVPGVMVEFFVWYDVGMLAIRMEKIRGVTFTVMACRSLVSGSLIPLSFFPDTFRKIALALPFRFYIYTPIDVLLNGIEPKVLLMNLLFLGGWLLALIGIGNLQWNFGMRHYQANLS